MGAGRQAVRAADCTHPVDDFIAYARREAAALLDQHASVVEALAEALLEKLMLTDAEIDAVIAGAFVAEDLAAEKKRRAAMAALAASARAFEANHSEEEDVDDD
jgi:hypothetical protein